LPSHIPVVKSLCFPSRKLRRGELGALFVLASELHGQQIMNCGVDQRWPSDAVSTARRDGLYAITRLLQP